MGRNNRSPAPTPTTALPDAPAPPPEPAVEAVLGDPAVLWEAVWRTTGEFVAIVDRTGIIRACNRVEDGFSIDQVVGHSLVRFTLPESSAALESMLRQVFADGEMRTLETTVRRTDGDLSYFSLRLAPLRHEERIVAVMICCENLRPLKHTERELTRERGVLRRLIEIQEKERQLVSYEIHDGLAQYISGAIMHLEAYRHTVQGAAGSQLEEGLRLLRAAAEESRRLIGGLRPPALDELGIVDAVESLVADARIEIPAVTFSHRLPEARLPAALETTIFRVVQESLTNARRHARARSASVTIEAVGGGVRVCIRDDGRGFDVAKVPDNRFGIEGIRQRCRLAGAEPRFESAPGQGTLVEVVLPLEARVA